MSLSTLGAQLAAINNASQGKQALPTSRRHEDAIGRGVGHSVQTGHSVFGKGHLYKASILYEDAKKASDVPLTTIQENCVTSLRELEELDPVFGEFVDSLCTNSSERGLNTRQENASIDEEIQRLLFRMSLRLGTSKRITAACLHIIEFLLRRHDLHIRPRLVSTTLLVLLPHHEKPYFLRFIQLVDLASLPTYAWLRPYTIPNARVGRELISKHVSKNVALLREMLSFASRASQLPKHDATMAFLAAVIVYAMTLQQRRTGSVEELSCQALLPTIIGACTTSIKESSAYRNFGYILASTLAETSNLGEEPRHLVVASILRGLSGSECESSLVQNGLVVALTLLQQYAPSGHSSDKSTFQLKIGKQMKFGYPINKSILHALTRIENVALHLGHLFAEEGIVDFAHWITSIWVTGWQRLQKPTKKHKQTEVHLKHSRVEALLTDLLVDPQLSTHLWTHDWIQALTCYTLSTSTVPTGPNSVESDTEHSFLSEILKILRSKNAAAYDRGVTKALMKLKHQQRISLASWLGLVSSNKDSSVPETSIALPVRVGLEHADVEVRLEAIARINNKQSLANMPEKGGGETLVEALCRRLISDDDFEVVSKTAEALCNLHASNKGAFFSKREAVTTSVLQTLQTWSEKSSIGGHSRATMTAEMVQLASIAALLEEKRSTSFVSLMEVIGTYLVHSNGAITEAANKSIINALGKKTKAKGLHSLASDPELLVCFSRKMEGTKAENRIRRRFFSVLLAPLSEEAEKEKETSFAKSVEVLEYCIWGMKHFSDDLSNSDFKLLSNILKLNAKKLLLSPREALTYTVQIGCLPSNAYESAGAAFVEQLSCSIQGPSGGEIAPISFLMEAVLQSTSQNGMLHLLSMAEHTFESRTQDCQFGLIPAIALICDEDEFIRKKAISMMPLIGKSLSKSRKFSSLAEICHYISKNSTSANMGSPSFLSECLSAVGGKGDIASAFLTLFLYTSVAVTPSTDLSSQEILSQSWLQPGQTTGGYRACLVLLKAIHEAGEAIFPIADMWKILARPILEVFFLSNQEVHGGSTHLIELMEKITLTLKGFKGSGKANGPSATANTIIMSGPTGRGGRRRSYSFGISESSSFLSPYPDDMISCIVEILTNNTEGPFHRQIRDFVCIQTLSSKSWGEHVFEKLVESKRRKIANAVLKCTVDGMANSADEALFALPLTCRDYSSLLGEGRKAEDGLLASLTYCADSLIANADRLVLDPKMAEVARVLLEKVVKLSVMSETQNEGIDFARDSLLYALEELLVAIEAASPKRFQLSKNKKFGEWIDTLVGILGQDDDSKFRPVESTRSKKTVLSILSSLCSIHPEQTKHSLVPAIISLVSTAKTERVATLVAESLALIVPVYMNEGRKGGLTEMHLMNSFLSASNQGINESARILLYRGFVDSLSKTDANSNENEEFIGSFVATCLAANLFYARKDGADLLQTNFFGHVMSHVTVSSRVPVILSLLGYAKEIVLKLAGEIKEYDDIKMLQLVSTARLGPLQSSKASKVSTTTNPEIDLCTSLVSTVCEIIVSPGFCKFLRHSKSSTSPLLLRLWQDLLVVQAVGNNKGHSERGGGNKFWFLLAEVTKEMLESIQKHLPSHIFLAFATSLIKDSDSRELRSRALQLIADRCTLIEPTDPEATLYRDMLPFLSTLLRSDQEPYVQQAILVAIEHVGRHLCSKQEYQNSKYLEPMVESTMRCAKLVETYTTSFITDSQAYDSADSATKQLLCTAMLCAATAVQICGPRILPILPTLMKPSISLMCYLNENFESTRTLDLHDKSQAKLLQLSILRLLTGVTRKMPQFLSPYLGLLFQPNSLPSVALREMDDEQSVEIMGAAERLDSALAKQVPVRQLLPRVSTALGKLKDVTGASCLLSIMSQSITVTKGKELGTQLGCIVQAGSHVLEISAGGPNSEGVIAATNDMFLSLVMKLSEVQFRSLYGMLWSWRGSFDMQSPSIMASRRCGFWSLSAMMATNLKSIFLPCLTTVFSDALAELNCAASVLNYRRGSKATGEAKRQRIDNTSQSTNFDDKSALALKALLNCMEVSLKADAHNGGSWTRENESQRFELILEPLGKLLECQIPKEIESTTSFQTLVIGNESESGSVVDCMVALASAAGDERLWKPLNHKILQACSNENRPEVRKAGVKCLASIVRSVGEEYMVLIPECLPVLSELLEESDEEIAGFAQECITISEELLGESLEENLR